MFSDRMHVDAVLRENGQTVATEQNGVHRPTTVRMRFLQVSVFRNVNQTRRIRTDEEPMSPVKRRQAEEVRPSVELKLDRP